MIFITPYLKITKISFLSRALINYFYLFVCLFLPASTFFPFFFFFSPFFNSIFFHLISFNLNSISRFEQIGKYALLNFDYIFLIKFLIEFGYVVCKDIQILMYHGSKIEYTEQVVLISDGTSDHVAHMLRKTDLFRGKISNL